MVAQKGSFKQLLLNNFFYKFISLIVASSIWCFLFFSREYTEPYVYFVKANPPVFGQIIGDRTNEIYVEIKTTRMLHFDLKKSDKKIDVNLKLIGSNEVHITKNLLKLGSKLTVDVKPAYLSINVEKK